MKNKLSLLVLSAFSIVGCGKTESVKQSEDNDKSFIADMQVSTSATITQEMINKLVVYGKYSNCRDKTASDTWQISQNLSTSNLIVKKGDTNCRIYVTGFSLFQNNTLTRYNDVNTTGLVANQDFGTTAAVFAAGQGNVDKLYTFAKITPADFSAKPTLSIHITSVKDGGVSTLASIKDVFVVEQNNLNINMLKGPNFKIENTNFKAYVDKDDSAISLQGNLVFKNQENVVFERLDIAIIPGSESTNTFEEIASKFKFPNSWEISSSIHNSFVISGSTVHDKAKIPANWTNVNLNNLSAKIILREKKTINAKEVYSYQVFNLTVSK
ncbi:hypothetical protein [Pigmentibacter ruber]|uniref:hypothetical protein n=1 Tax=Pigmentibacter ruber TaxID=2683196 RepID=UPI00131EA9B9|nr:hypothetical protein [Pigmentibacter ruber]